MLKDKSINIRELVDVSFLQELFEKYYKVSNTTIGLLEPNGNILVDVGWQKACTEFHRKGKISCANCVESDSHISCRLHENPPISYKCKNGLNDVAMPVVIEGNHIANLFFGQFFYEDDAIDDEVFRKQAKENGFNEKEYLDAIHKVPMYSKKEVTDILEFYMSLLDVVVKLAYQNLEKETENKNLESKILNKLHEIEERNKELNCLYEISDYSHQEITEKEFFEKVIAIIPPSFQYPEICEVKIQYGAETYKTPNYIESKWSLKKDIVVDSKKLGEIEICFVKESKQHNHGPFLKEELSLIDGIAEIISKTVENKRKELEIKEKNEEYLAVNEELREKNEEFLALNEELKEKNDEYQSLYEEYLAQNEELQEQNEEYQAINEELEEEMAQRAAAEKEIALAHEHQLALFDGIEDVIYVADPDTYELLYFNETARNIWGEDFAGKKCYKVLQDRDEPCPFCSNDKILGENIGKHYVWEFQNEVSNQWFRCADKAIKWNNGKMVRFELASEISELKNTQNKLLENENRLKTLLESIPTGIVLVDKETRKIEETNNYALELLECKEEQIIDSHCTKIFCQDENGKCPICDLNQEVDLSEKAIITKKGNQIPILKSVTKIQINGKEKLLESFIDISKLKESEEQLIESEERFRNIFEHSSVGKSMTGLDGSLKVNKAFSNIIGYTSDELKEIDWKNITHKDDIEKSEQVIKDLLDKKSKQKHFEKRYIHKNGNVVYTDVNTTLLRDNKDKPLYFITAITDITDRKQQELQLANYANKLDLALKGGEIGVWEWNLEKDITTWDSKMEEIFGLEIGSFNKSYDHFKSCLHPDDTSITERAIKNAIEKDIPYDIVYRVIWKNDEVRYIKAKADVIRDINKKPIEMVGVCIDITNLKRNEQDLISLNEELLRSNQDLEQFAYVASHDLQEPLRKVKTFAELFAKKYTGAIDEKADQYIGYMTSGADRMQNLILDLLAFSRVATRGKDFVKVDLNNTIEAVLEDLQIIIKESNAHIQIEKLPSIKVDEMQIMQLFQNLISNALKFKSDKEPIINISGIDKKTHWQFCVADNGIGIEMQYAERIFEVFQRLHSKEQYKGTGIGLAICKKIIERHKGKIWVVSDPNKGSEFYFTISKKLNKQRNTKNGKTA